jgi:hypothetical protein
VSLEHLLNSWYPSITNPESITQSETEDLALAVAPHGRQHHIVELRALSHGTKIFDQLRSSSGNRDTQLKAARSLESVGSSELRVDPPPRVEGLSFVPDRPHHCHLLSRVHVYT